MQHALIKLALLTMLATGLAACDKPADTVKQNDSKAATAGSLVGSPRPDFTLKDIEDKQRSASEWNGKVLVVNFWATWCPPCRKEMPSFIALQEQYGKDGLQFVGIAIDDKDKVVDFSDTYGVNYPMLLGELEAIKLAKQYGNRFGALPYTVIIGRDGKIAFTVRGELEKHVAETEIKKLL